MPLPFGYTLLPGPPSQPPPNGVTYAPGTDGRWYSYPAPGQDNSVLSAGDTNVSGNLPALPAIGASDTSSAAPTSGIFGLTAWFDRMFPSTLGAMDSSVGLNPNVSGSLLATNGPAAGLSSAVAFITDVPRVTTTILGLILIIAGIFALARGPAVQVIQYAVRENVTS